jgi:subtilisin family serine protease
MGYVMQRFLVILSVIFFLFTGCSRKANTEVIPEYDGVVIALLDTGISKAAIEEERILAGYNYVENTEDTNDKINHGTAVASVIVGSLAAKIEGIAPDALLVPLVVTSKDENGSLQSITPELLAQVIYDSVEKYKADIINISLGIKKDLPEIKEAVDYAKEQGVMVISAVGNNGKDEDYYYPAAYDAVLAVGSHNEQGKLSDFSQQNGTADILAPGEDIWLASKNGQTYGAKGTSYATAYAAAAAAKLLAEKPELTPEEIREILLHTAIEIVEEESDSDYNTGILNLDGALEYITNIKP